MNFNNDLSKIPLPSYPIPGLTELMEEIPQTGPGQLHSLSHHDTRHEAVSKVLTSPDSMLVSQIVDAFATNSSEHMSNQRDSNLESVNVQPLLHGVSSDVYGHRNLMQMQGSLNSNLSHVAPFVTPNPPASNTMPAMFTNDPVSNLRNSALYPGNANRSLTARPVQAVAPLPRNPQVSEREELTEVHRPTHEQKSTPTVNPPAVEQPPPPQENPKICLKIKRTKKAHKEKKHSSKHSSSNEYGVIASDTKPDGAGPIKLKISRLKSSSSGHSSKSASSEETFKVSSLTANDPPMKSEAGADSVKQKASTPANDAATVSLKDIALPPEPRRGDSPHKAKASKSEKHKHKHASGGGQWAGNANQITAGHQPQPPLPQQSKVSQNNKSQSYLQNQTLHSSSTLKTQAANSEPKQHTSSHSGYSKHNRSSASQQQNRLNNSPYVKSPGMDQQTQQFLQQKQFMASSMHPYHPAVSNPLAQFPYATSLSQTSMQGQGSFSSALWDQNKPDSRNAFQQVSTAQGVASSRPPPYSEAMIAQQQLMQNQLYQSLQMHAGTSMHQQQKQKLAQQEKQLQQQHRVQHQPHLQQAQQSTTQKHEHKNQQAAFAQQQQPFVQPKQKQFSQNQAQVQQQHIHVAQQQQQSAPQPRQQQQSASQPMQQQQQPMAQPLQQQQQQPVPQPIQQGSFSQPPYVSSQPENSNSSFQHARQFYSQTVPPKKKAHMHAAESIPSQHPHHLQQPQHVPQHTPNRSSSKHRKDYDTPHPRSDQSNQANAYTGPNYMNTPRQSTARAPAPSKSKKGLQHVRVKFDADHEEADIYKLKDIMYPDDTEVNRFEDLNPGDEVIAKWPMNGKMYSAVVIDPLDNTGRKFRERKPPPKPFQAQFGSSRSKKIIDGPSVVLDKLASSNIPAGLKLSEPLPEDGFNAYISMADRIKLKKRERMAKEAKLREGKKRKRDDSESSNLINVNSDESDSEFTSPARKKSHQSEQKKKARRKLVEMRFSQEDGAGAFQRLLDSVQGIFDRMDSLDPRILDDAMNGEKDAKVPQCLLISNSTLHELSGETAKLKILGLLCQLPRKVLVRLLTVLEPNIRDGINLKPMKPKGNTAEEQKWNRDCRLDRVNRSTEAALAVMHVMTARFMPKAVYIDDVIERTVQLLRNQLTNTIYPEYDPVYKAPSTQSKKKGSKELMSTASTRMKRAHFKGPKNRNILQLYNKLNILLNQMVELVEIQPLTDTSILQISSLGVSPFFVENVRELQLSAIRLTTSVFSRYDKHRSLILEDIFQSLARLPTSKRNLRNYRLTYAEEAIDSSDEEDTSGGRKAGGTGGAELQYIQMMSALVLQMIHAIAQLPLPDIPDDDMTQQDKRLQNEVDEMKVITSYDTAVRTGQNFLAVFLKKCASKSEEIDYRPLFENLIHDLLATVNKPEWPASEMLLSVLGRLLVHTFSTKSTEMSLRVAALDYLGVVAAKLRRDAVTSFTDVRSVVALLERLEEASKEDVPDKEPTEEEEQKEEKAEEPKKEKKSKHAKQSKDEILTNRLQYLLLGYLRRNALADPSLLFAHNFYIAQWLRDISHEFQQLQQKEEKGDPGEQLTLQNKALQACQTKKDKLLELASSAAIATRSLTEQHDETEQKKMLTKVSPMQEKFDSRERGRVCLQRLAEALDFDSLASLRNKRPKAGNSIKTPLVFDWKDIHNLRCCVAAVKSLVSKASSSRADKLAMGLTVEDAALLSRHLASTRSFSKAFDCYLSYILRVRDESAVALRTRAIKCLAEVVAVDPSIMEREDIAQGVQSSLVDASTSVREAAIDLVGKFILLKPGLVKHYYNMLTARILDTGVSVRKRVIRILRDLCHEHPSLPQLTDACVKMIRRVNDEEGIKKLVHEVFLKMWFTPADPHDTASLRKKALLITDIVAANRERGYEWIEQLFKNLIDTPTRNQQVEDACKQIVNCLVEHVIIFESPQNKQNESSNTEDISENDVDPSTIKANCSSSDANKAKERSIRLVATVQTLVQLAKIRPKLLVPHVMTLQPYLATKCETADDVLTIHGVCRTLELAIPLMEHPSEAFLASIEEDMMRMILTHRFHVVAAAVSCLGAVTLRVTHNYRLIWDCFQRMCNGLNNARMMHEKNAEALFHPKHLKQLLRTLFIIGHFSKNFDFDNEKVKGKTQVNVCVKDKVYDCLYYFTVLPVTSITEELCGYSIAALGLLMIQDPNMMFRTTTRNLYKTFLDPAQKSVRLKKQVLQNLQNYLQMEDIKMQQAAEASAKKAKHEEDKEHLNEAEARAAAGELGIQDDIKEICDVSSGMASSVMQLFLKQVLDAFFHRHVMVRHAALHTVYLTLQQGLVHPAQCVPYLIAAASDPESSVHKEADQQLVELSKKYHGFVHTKALQGVKLAYQLQSFVQPSGHVVRGYVERSSPSLDDGTGTNLKASCSQLYQLVRSDRKHRRALLLSLLNLFDDTIKTDLKMLVFVADNLAYFPYYTLDEPLHLISQIEVYVSVSGSNVLQSFKESLSSKKAKRAEREERRAARLRMKEEKRRRREERDGDASGISDSSSSSSSSESSSSDDDDSDMEGEAIESRLPARDEAIEEFAHLSLACLLLLWLKQHLKTLFGFTDNKIHRYSPTEANRANDKQCNRKRPDLRFEPTPALEHIDRLKRQVHCREPEYVNAVSRIYSEFNEMMNKLDPNDDDSDSDREKSSAAKNQPVQEAKTKEPEEMEESDRDTDGETKQAGTLDAIRQSTALKSKKRRPSHEGRDFEAGTSYGAPQMRTHAPVKYVESSSDSDEDFRGF